MFRGSVTGARPRGYFLRRGAICLHDGRRREETVVRGVVPR